MIIKVSASNAPSNPNPIQDGKAWFESQIGKPNVNLAPFVAFGAKDVLDLVLNQASKKVVISKQLHDNQITLGLAGITPVGYLQAGTYQRQGNTIDHVGLIGTPIANVAGNRQIKIDFSNLLGADNGNTRFMTSFVSTGDFITIIGRFQKKSEPSNLFATVNFRVEELLPVLNANNVSKIAFIKGYCTMTQKTDPHPEDSFALSIDVSADLEALVAVGIDENNQVVTDVVMPETTWPVRWQRYA